MIIESNKEGGDHVEVLKKLWQNKQSRSSMITAALAFVLMISLLIAAFQVNAWFKSHITVSSPAVITNFDTVVEYCVDENTNKWITVPTGASIPVSLKDGAVLLNSEKINNLAEGYDKIKIRIIYKGKSSAYLRFSLSGSFQNADTGTYLPQLDSIWDASGTNWIEDGEYWYYENKLGDIYDPDKSVNEYKETHELNTFTITVDPTKFPKDISSHQDYQGELFITVDTVQPDRYKAFWGVNELPFISSYITISTTVVSTE